VSSHSNVAVIKC